MTRSDMQFLPKSNVDGNESRDKYRTKIRFLLLGEITILAIVNILHTFASGYCLTIPEVI